MRGGVKEPIKTAGFAVEEGELKMYPSNERSLFVVRKSTQDERFLKHTAVHLHGISVPTNCTIF